MKILVENQDHYLAFEKLFPDSLFTVIKSDDNNSILSEAKMHLVGNQKGYVCVSLEAARPSVLFDLCKACDVSRSPVVVVRGNTCNTYDLARAIAMGAYPLRLPSCATVTGFTLERIWRWHQERLDE